MQKKQIRSHKQNAYLGKLQIYTLIHGHALFSSLGRLLRTPFTSSMTIAVMAIAISLAAGFYLLVINAQQLTGSVKASNQISLFLKTRVSERVALELVDKIRRNERIESVSYISKSQALAEFKKSSGFGEALDILDDNPLPAVIQILPKHTLDDMQEVSVIQKDYEKLPEVDFAQLDMKWIKRLQTIMKLMRREVFLISLLLSFAVIFITGNTIRLELQNRKDEVLVEKLVGATNAFIQRPFLYTGFWLGFIAGLIAWLLVMMIVFVLQSPVKELSTLYDASIKILYLGLTDSLFLLIISSLLGVLGSWLVLRFQLQQIKPQ